MLFRPAILEGIRDGRVTLAIRRWPRPRVRPGGRQRTAIGVVAFDAVKAVDRDDLDEGDARDAGLASLDELLAFVDGREGTIYRIRLRLAGKDPRVALRATLPDDDALRDLERRLGRLDRASRHGPWTDAVLRAIAEMPAVRAADLAARFGRETQPFKVDVRKLKELGLTESLEVGYRLSARGAAFLASRPAR
ncbi:MAG: hypothetical protein ACRDE6_04680 [Candidatus Limnocylindria bacterium]